jgi:hypothetical protein
MNLTAGLNDMDKLKFLILSGLELLPLGCPARNQSLYALHYNVESWNIAEYVKAKSI